MAEQHASPAPQPVSFLLLYALAAAGGAVAYMPFLTVLLPLQVAAITGSETVNDLAYATFGGAIAASLANIGFGWLSDRTGSRRGWIAAGLVLSCGLLVAIGSAQSIPVLIALLFAWQVALNMMLSPLGAWAGDCVPDAQKGTLGGLLSWAPALGALSGIVVTYPGLAEGSDRLWLVAGLVCVMVTPALVAGGGKVRPALMEPAVIDKRERREWNLHSAVSRMWLARLLVQVAEASLFAFMLFWLRSLQPGFPENSVATIFGITLAASVPLTMALGRWSDRTGRPIVPLVWSSGGAALGLAIMTFATDLTFGVAGYVVFALSGAVFLALHTSQTLRVLPRPQVRGRDLGIFNLTNTIPSLVMPWMTVALVPVFGFSALFALLAVLAIAAMLLLLAIVRSD